MTGTQIAAGLVAGDGVAGASSSNLSEPPNLGAAVSPKAAAPFLGWDKTTITLLTLYWREGLTTAEIGRRVGCGKNAVVGKAHRLNLPERGSPIKRRAA